MSQDAIDRRFVPPARRSTFGVPQFLTALVVGGGLTAAAIKAPEIVSFAKENFGGATAGAAPEGGVNNGVENGAWQPDPQLGIGLVQFTPDGQYVNGISIATQGDGVGTPRCHYLERSHPSIEALEEAACISSEQAVGLRRMQQDFLINRENTD